MTAGIIPEEIPAAVVPLRRSGLPDDIAGLILYMASRASAYVSGNVFVIDGGRLGLYPSTY